MVNSHVRWVVPGSAPEPRTSAGDIGQRQSFDILMVIPTLPFPPIWGFGQRAYQLARHLARQHRVTVVAYASSAQRPDVEEMARVVHEVVAVVGEPPRGLRRRLMQVKSLASRVPFHAASLRTRALQGAVDDTLARHHFDVILLESSQMGWVSSPPGLPVVIDEHNIESELLERMADSERTVLRRLFHEIEFRRYRRFEDRTWAASAGCTTTSSRDAARLYSRRPEVLVAIVPNGVDVDQFAPQASHEAPGRLIFTGLMDYRPNFDGISWFLDEIYPLIQQRRPDVQLQIVGHGSPEVLDELRGPGIEVTGRVPDLRSYLDDATVAIVPLRIGGGTRLKVVEAMSMGKAIVSTALGAEGIQVADGEHCLVADNTTEFAEAVCRLLDDPDLRRRLAINARALAVEDYSWQRSSDHMSALLERVVLDPDGTSRRAHAHQGDASREGSE
jgi:polysaccharide biosynthesis protein PslH